VLLPSWPLLIRPHASFGLLRSTRSYGRTRHDPLRSLLIRPHATFGLLRPTRSFGRTRHTAPRGQVAHAATRFSALAVLAHTAACDVRPPTANSLMRPHASSVAIASGPVALAVHIRCMCNSRDPAFAALLGPFRRWELHTGDPYHEGKRQASGRTGDADKIKRIQGSSGAERSQIMHMRQIQGRSMSTSGAEPRYAYDPD